MGSKGMDVKKSSFYVWFLGAKESRGLRGEEYISPVVKQLTSREREQEPIKVTLEVTGKGLKIVQNLAPKRTSDNFRENIKHFIPCSSITCAVQEPRPNSDIISVILLIYNPATSCPVHVHSYRCDSGETASLLLDQLNRLINRPENQKKFQEIESRLQAKGLLQRNSSSAGSSRLGSDGRSLGRGSDSGAGSDKGSQLNPSDRIASMYDSLAAELREKLGAREPLLLPPRDYDTMLRSKGNIAGIEERRSQHPRIVGSIVGDTNGVVGGNNGVTTWSPGAGDSSGNSSGIGSKSPSPVQEGSSYIATSPEHNFIQQDSNSSDEDWGAGVNGVINGRRRNGDDRNQSEDSLLLPPEQPWSPQDNEPANMGGQSKPLSSRFFPSKRSVSPTKSGKDRKESPDCAKERFRGAKQLFMSLERKKGKDKKGVKGEGKAEPSPHRVLSPSRSSKEQQELLKTSISLEAKQLEGQARWSRYEREAIGRAGVMMQRPSPDQGPDSRWPKSDKDTGYVSRYSRDKSRSRDFDESPPSGGGGSGNRGSMFTKSGKKTNSETKDKYTSKRLSRFLSRETLESDGYDKIDEFDEPDPHRNKVKRNPSRTSLKLDYRRQEDPLPEIPGGGPHGPRRGMLRREMTELDIKGYMQAQQNRNQHDPRNQGLSRKYNPRQGPVWLPGLGGPPGMMPGGGPPGMMPGGPQHHHPQPKDRSLSPARALSPMRSGPGRFNPSGPIEDPRFPVTKIIPPEFSRKDMMRGPPSHSADRYPSLDLRNEKRKSMFEQEMRNFEMMGPADYRRRSYHELSEVDKLDPPMSRNFQHSGRKQMGGGDPSPMGLPSRTRNIMSYKQLPDQQRFPGLDRENSRINSMGPIPFKSVPYNHSKPMPFDHPSNRPSFDHHMSAVNRPAMYRHSYAEPSPPPAFIPPPQHMPGRGYGLSSLKPF